MTIKPVPVVGDEKKMSDANAKAIDSAVRAGGSNSAGVRKGSLTASCGHTLTDGERTVSVVYGDYDCDAIDGFSRCVVYASFCPRCATERSGEFFKTKAEADAWLDGEDEPTSPASER